MQNSPVRVDKIVLGSGKTAYQLYANVGGRKFRQRFDSEVEALGRQNQLEAEESEYRSYPPLQPTPLNRTQLADAELALEQLERRFPNRTLTWAVTALHDLEPEIPPIQLAEAVLQFIELKTPVVNRKTVRDYQNNLGRLQTVTGKAKLHEVTLKHIRAYFEKLEAEALQNATRPTKRDPKGKPNTVSNFGNGLVANGTYNHHLSRLSTFFNWCAKALPDARQPKKNPCSGLEPRPKCEMPREILSPEEAKDFMRFAEQFEGGRLVNYYAFALLAGLRPDIDGELGKVARNPPPNLVDLKHGLIRLPASYTKTRRPREIDISPALLSYIEKFPLDQYPLQPAGRKIDGKRTQKQILRNCLERSRTACPIHLPHDVLRHSYISYHLRLSGEYAETSRQAGNTEDIIRRHYQRRVTREEADQFWAIRPAN